MKDHSHRLLTVLRDQTASKEFKQTSLELLNSILLPNWHKLPEPDSKGVDAPLTIGMATMDDYDGVYFSIQALRLYHPEILERVELIVIDNNPQSKSGEAVAEFVGKLPRATYVPFAIRSGTAVRDAIFRYARGRFVLCMDCHVLFPAGALAQLLHFIERNPDCSDLLQGPLLDDDMTTISSHLKDEWNACFWGRWENDGRANSPEGEPFEISMQGLGVFCCRREAWPGFNPRTKGFGGEEGSLQQLFRNRGDKTVCLPFLRWLHRFCRPLGVPYSNQLEERVRNYLILFADARLDPQPALAHFATKMESNVLERVVQAHEFERAHPSYRFDMLFALAKSADEIAPCFAQNRLFQRAVLRCLGRSEHYEDLPLFVALRECCREALILGLKQWCVIIIGQLTPEQVQARLELLEYIDWNTLWKDSPRAKLGPAIELWTFDALSAQHFVSSTPGTLVETVDQKWHIDTFDKLERAQALTSESDPTSREVQNEPT